jgi:hypothetical protein
MAGRSGRPRSWSTLTVAAGEHRPDHSQGLRATVRALGRQPESLIDQVAQADPLRQGCGRHQPGVRHQIRLGEPY